MNQKALKIINPLLFLVILTQGVSVLCMKLGWIYAAAYTVHNVLGFVLMGLILFHIIFNWSWVKVNILKKKKSTPEK